MNKTVLNSFPRIGPDCLHIGLVFGLLMVLCVWVAVAGYPELNQRLFDSINTLGGRGRWIWANLTTLGEGLTAFVLLACFSRRNGKFIWMLLLVAFIAGISSQLLKGIFDMPRPAALLAPDSFNLIGAELRSRAFPSGHATTALAAAPLLAWRFPGWKAPIYVFFLFVAMSRIPVGAHWPFDVVAGGCLGYLCSRVGLWWSVNRFNTERIWVSILAWALVLVLALWLFFIPLDYPAAKPLTLILAAAGLVRAAMNLWNLITK